MANKSVLAPLMLVALAVNTPEIPTLYGSLVRPLRFRLLSLKYTVPCCAPAAATVQVL
jgi:hypothetical protein